MTDMMRYGLVILGAILFALAAFWPRPDKVILSRGAATALEPSYSFTTEPLDYAGVFMSDGQPRYILRGRAATADEFRRARSPEEWEQAQAWIAAQRVRPEAR